MQQAGSDSTNLLERFTLKTIKCHTIIQVMIFFFFATISSQYAAVPKPVIHVLLSNALLSSTVLRLSLQLKMRPGYKTFWASRDV